MITEFILESKTYENIRSSKPTKYCGWKNLGQCALFHGKDGERNARASQKIMYVINENGEEGSS